MSVSPEQAVTGPSGQAVFTITATKKTGNAKLIFEAEGLRDKVSVKVEKNKGKGKDHDHDDHDDHDDDDDHDHGKNRRH
ncbi:MAG: hypothetical protein CV087_06115 [Candidatus Brocadia sp. WS118]|nr:MAG: hypothetical protein CV087_06115 [Candidatus Brocadia sp. WS118]